MGFFFYGEIYTLKGTIVYGNWFPLQFTVWKSLILTAEVTLNREQDIVQYFLVHVCGSTHLAHYCSAYAEAGGRVIPTFAPELSSHSAAFYLVLPFHLNLLCSLLFSFFQNSYIIIYCFLSSFSFQYFV